MSNKAIKSVVLVHGGFVDGSGWEGTYRALTKKGYKVSIVQNPTISLQDDVAVTKRVIDAADGDVILSAIPMAARSSAKPAIIRRSPGWSMSPPLRWTPANPSPS